MEKDNNIDEEREPRGLIKEVISRYIQEKPRRISSKLCWDEERSTVSIGGDNFYRVIEHPQAISFTSFAHGVVDAYREAYGELKVVPISFREEVYKNDKVSLDLYPTGSLGIFDIFIDYEEARLRT